MYLGISCFFHDSAAAIVDDNKIICAAEEERFTRIKHDSSFPSNAIEFCLEKANIKANELNYVAFYEDPKLKFDRVAMGLIKQAFSRKFSSTKNILLDWATIKSDISGIISKKIEVNEEKILFFKHHESHRSSAFNASGFENSAIMTLDGVGEWDTASFGEIKDGGDYTEFANNKFPHSLGLLYSCFAEFLGFEVNEGEFKVMGMAAYGKPKYKNEIKKLFKSIEGFNFELDRKFFSYEYSDASNLAKPFIDLFGETRKPESPFLAFGNKNFSNDIKFADSTAEYYADISASFQSVFEDIVLDFAKTLFKTSNSKNLCYAGGVALNSVLNGRIIRESGFQNVFIQPASGDSGSALGAAMLAWEKNTRNKKRPEGFTLLKGNLGKEICETSILTQLRRSKLEGMSFKLTELEIIEKLVEELTNSKVCALAREGFEFGPRALGYRSIIADPRSAEMKARVNHAVKFRELFRPFAPIVAKEYACEYFEFSDRDLEQQPFRFMMGVTNVRKDYQAKLEAITHVDGTARVQIVCGESNPFLHKLLLKFGEKSGVAVLLNTSFNRRGEPIVASAKDAINAFLWTNIETLVLNDWMIFKNSGVTKTE